MHKTDPLGLYIHIPFCSRKCKYCDFYSLPKSEKLFFDYTERVVEAIDFYSEKYARCYNSLYFGGGTPLLLGDGQLLRILGASSSRLSVGAEVTLEGNPGVTERVNFSALRDGGANRLSFGLQSAKDSELAALGRIHTAKDAAETVRIAQRAGFENISLDLMLGIPYQTKESLLESIRFCADLGVQHISAYMLKIEPGTALAKDGELCSLCADDDELGDMYLLACEELSKQGFTQYEISNFAKPGYESRHNLKYWESEDYLGIGPAAHSFIDGRRFYFDRDIGDFLSLPFEEAEREEGAGGGWEEYSMLRLRLSKGLDLGELSRLYPEAPTAQILRNAKDFLGTGLLKIEGERIVFTSKGFAVGNALTGEILY